MFAGREIAAEEIGERHCITDDGCRDGRKQRHVGDPGETAGCDADHDASPSRQADAGGDGNVDNDERGDPGEEAAGDPADHEVFEGFGGAPYGDARRGGDEHRPDEVGVTQKRPEGQEGQDSADDAEDQTECIDKAHDALPLIYALRAN